MQVGLEAVQVIDKGLDLVVEEDASVGIDDKESGGESVLAHIETDKSLVPYHAPCLLARDSGEEVGGGPPNHNLPVDRGSQAHSHADLTASFPSSLSYPFRLWKVQLT